MYPYYKWSAGSDRFCLERPAVQVACIGTHPAVYSGTLHMYAENVEISTNPTNLLLCTDDPVAFSRVLVEPCVRLVGEFLG